MRKADIIKEYLDSERNYKLLETKQERILFILSILRLVFFVGGFILIWICFNIKTVAGIVSLIMVAGIFLYLLKLYWLHEGRRDFYSNLAVINHKEAVAIKGDSSAFEPGNHYIVNNHDFSNDIDLFGNASVFQYLNRTVTGFGRDTLAAWLTSPFSLSQELTSRQEAISELTEKVKWRQKFMAYGMKASLEKKEIDDILSWLGESSAAEVPLLKKVLIYLLPSVAFLSLLLMITGILDYYVFTFVFLINLLYVTSGIKKTNRVHRVLSRKYELLSSIDNLLKVFSDEPFKSKILNEIELNISGRHISARVSVKKLNRLVQMFDSRMNLFAGFLLNGLFLWDYQSVYRLEKWKSENRELFPVWLEMLGKVDAFISLANYAYNNPDFVYPVISEENIVFAARDLGHQLIDDSKRVCNDFSIEKGKVCIISGANMAGKSTFLRTVAVNHIIGMTGAPVCASEMIFRPSNLFTSMRTTDSLSDNESYFYAELKRLKTLKLRIEAGEPILFILDEILKGTNSADKSVGSKLYLEKLVDLGGTGLIATHDISLGKMEEDHQKSILNKCFEIEIEGDKIFFDYKLQEGITSKMNAAILMKQMGIVE